MKGAIIIQFALVVAVTVIAHPLDNDKYALNTFNSHHVSHQESVDAARQGMNQRLSHLERRVGQRSQALSNCGSCVTGDSYSQSSRLSSSSSSHGLTGSDYVGVGYVGHADDEDTQQRISPVSTYGQTHNRYSSSNAYREENEEEDLQQRHVVPTDLHGIQASAYRSSANREEEEEDTQRTVDVGYHDALVNNEGSYTRRTQQQREQYESETSRTGPKVYYVPAPVTSSSHRHSSSSGSESDYQETRTAPQRISLQVRPGTTTVLQVPIRVNTLNAVGVPESSSQYSSNSRSSGYQQSLHQQQVQPTQRVTYYVPASSDRYDSSSSSRTGSETSRTSYVQQPEKYVAPDLTAYNSYSSQSRSNVDDESDVQTRVRPYQPAVTDGGSSRYSSSSRSQAENSQRTQVRIEPSFPVTNVESSSSHRTAEEQRERQYSSRPNYIHRTPITAEESRRTEGSSSYGSSGSTVYRASPITSNSQQSRQHLSQSQQQQTSSRINSSGGSNFSPYSPPYPSSSSSTSRHGSGVINLNTDNLHEYMSESQRLAEMQQRQLAASSQTQHQGASSSYSNAAEANRRTVDLAQRLDSAAANFVSSSNLANRNSEYDAESLSGQSLPSGYQRVKSWQKQSKWESGSQYGTDGKPKTYSMLSTAEAEKHNINGQSTGYKAATTTLENDGKVSTYSIHTP